MAGKVLATLFFDSEELLHCHMEAPLILTHMCHNSEETSSLTESCRADVRRVAFGRRCLDTSRPRSLFYEKWRA